MDFEDGPIDARISETRAHRLPIFFCVGALWALLIIAEFLHPCYFLHDDNADQFLGNYLHDYRVLAETGRVAEVNYYQYGGEPFLEQGQTAVLYPPIYIAVALAKAIPGDARWTIEWLVAIHLTFGLLGFYGWLRQGGVMHGIAAVAALAWVLQPFIFLIASSWIMVTYVAAWLPWLFWATDRLFIRPAVGWAVLLGSFFGLFFLQGYVQWVIYTALFLSLYVIFGLCRRGALPRAKILYQLLIAAVVFLILALPLMLPMLHAVAHSNMRAQPFGLSRALYYSAGLRDVVRAQFGLFRSQFMFDMTSAIFYCPALWLVPVMIVAVTRGDALVRQRLLPLLMLAALALLFASRWHSILSELPVFSHFRWPFKVFIFADFFLLAALAWSLSSWARREFAFVLMAAVLVTDAAVSISFHDMNFFSDTKVPVASPLVAGMDPTLGRTIAIDDRMPYAMMPLLLADAYGTYYQMPSLGGYNPLVARDQQSYALGLDFPNLYLGPVNDEVRKELEARAVRYWMVDANAAQLPAIRNMDDLEILASDSKRVIFEDSGALPIVFSSDMKGSPVSFRYSGNSLLIPLSGATSPIYISLCHDTGWWYRIDGGQWKDPWDLWHDDSGSSLLEIGVDRRDHLLEVTFIDPQFRHGLWMSLYLIFLLIVMIAISRLFPSR